MSKPRQHGFTLVELTVAMIAASIMVLGVASILSQSQRSSQRIHDRAFSDVVVQGYEAQHIFERLVRRGSVRDCTVYSNGSILEVKWYSGPAAIQPDRYVHFFFSNNQLLVETGELNANGTPNTGTGQTRTIAEDVQQCTFVKDNATARMHMVLDDGDTSMSVQASAVRQNP